MNIGDKVIAVGKGDKTKFAFQEIVRSKGRGGFDSLVRDMVVMTVTGIEGEKVTTKYYTFHKDDLHVVESPSAAPAVVEPTIRLEAGLYTADKLYSLADALNNN